jgi:hypothetical protein
VSAVQAANAGAYTVVVSNAAGKVTSQPATVNVNAGVTITTQPVSVNVNPGATATFSVSASGAAPLTYQWRKAGVNIPGATSSTYRIEAAGTVHVDSYDVVVSNPVGTVVSAAARLALNQAVAITTQPVGRLLVAGNAMELNVVATGTDPKTYQWSRNGVAIGGGTAATYRVASAQTADAGTYTVAVSNIVNSVTSAPAVMQVLQGVTITAQPAPLTLNPGTLAQFAQQNPGVASTPGFRNLSQFAQDMQPKPPSCWNLAPGVTMPGPNGSVLTATSHNSIQVVEPQTSKATKEQW